VPGTDAIAPTAPTNTSSVATPTVPTGLEVTLTMHDGKKMTKVFLLGAV
jgi:hypothetical protein